jgi:hypothetical protein
MNDLSDTPQSCSRCGGILSDYAGVPACPNCLFGEGELVRRFGLFQSDGQKIRSEGMTFPDLGRVGRVDVVLYRQDV